MNRRQAFVALVAACGLGIGGIVALFGGGAGRYAPDLPPPLIIEHAATGVTANLGPAEPAAGMVPLAMRISGRVAPTQPPSPGFRHRWPGTGAAASFRGDRVSLWFDDSVNRFAVQVDDRISVLLARPGRSALRIGGLGPGPHRAELRKIGESGDAAVFGGFFVEDGALAMPPPDAKARQIVFYGDSDMVGYGNTHDGRDCSDAGVFLATDTRLAFPALVAGHYGAGVRVIARSGLGLVRNYGGAEPGATLANLHGTTLIAAGDDKAGREPADIVVVGIGSNDFATPPGPGEAWSDAGALSAAFDAAFARFLEDLRAENPDALFVLLAFGEYGETLVSAYRQGMERLRSGGARAELVVLGPLMRTACHWHPSLADHRRIAAELIAAIDAGEPEW